MLKVFSPNDESRFVETMILRMDGQAYSFVQITVFDSA